MKELWLSVDIQVHVTSQYLKKKQFMKSMTLQNRNTSSMGIFHWHGSNLHGSRSSTMNDPERK